MANVTKLRLIQALFSSMSFGLPAQATTKEWFRHWSLGCVEPGPTLDTEAISSVRKTSHPIPF